MNCRRFFLMCVAAGLALTGHLLAQPITFTWTGSFNSNAHDARNWLGGVAPSSEGNEIIRFGPSRNNYIYYEGADFAGVEIIGNQRPYFFSGYSFHLGAQGLVYAPAVSGNPNNDFTQVYTTIHLTANQTWNIQSGRITIAFPVNNVTEAGPFHLTKTGAGTLELYSNNTQDSNWTGGMTVRDGRVVIFPRIDTQGSPLVTNSLGYGSVTFDSTQGGNPTLGTADWLPYFQSPSSYEGLHTIVGNHVAINGTLRLDNKSELMLAGGVTLLGNSTLHLNGDPLFITSAIAEQGAGRRLTLDGYGIAILDPQSQAGSVEPSPLNTYTGGTHVQNGGLIFATGTALPASGMLSMSTTGYIGYASTGGVANYLSKFDPATALGTIGFDSDPDGEVINTIENDINLTGLATGVRLGSFTAATLTGTITPSGTNYRFGGGGGTLTVTSSLTNGGAVGEITRGLVMDSPNGQPLTVWLTNNANTFTGGVTATNGALIFTPGALPATASLTLGTGGYIGTTAEFANNADYVAYLARFGGQGVIGFDVSPLSETPRTISNALTLPAGFYLGTNSRFGSDEIGFSPGLIVNGTLTGEIVGLNEVYRFAGYKGGHLEVATNLTNPVGQVLIGDPNSLGTFGDPIREEYSIVSLTGNNTYGGTTTLYTGHLLVGQSNLGYGTVPTTALGTGALLIQPHNITIPGEEDDDLFPLLSVASPATESTGPMIIANSIVLNNSLGLGGDNDIVLTGLLSGAGGLHIGEDSNYGITVRLDGLNTFTGGIYIERDSHVVFGGDTSAGLGRLSFGGGSNGSATFLSTNPILRGLESHNFSSINLGAGTTLTLDLADHTTYRGHIGLDNRAEITGPGGGVALSTDLIKTGLGSIRFENDLYVDNLYINSGTVIAASDGESTYRSLGDTVHVQGGSLLLQNSYLGSRLVLTSGTLGGSGTYQPFDNSTPVIGTGVSLSPGSALEGGIGNLHFYELNLAGLGTYVWNLRGFTGQNPADAARDHITVSSPSTLYVTASDINPFIIQAVTLDSTGVNGLVGGFVEGQTYSWSLLNYEGITGITQQFNPTNVLLNTSLFLTNLPGTTTLEFTNLSGAGSVILHFTAVPEPSTYALLALGLGFVGFTLWRRRRAA